MKWAILLGSPAISGGTYVIFEHAIRAYKRGEEITIVTMEPVLKSELYWHKEAENLRWKTYDEIKEELFDVVVATWWRSVYEAYRVTGKHYIYFVQSIESKFYDQIEKPTCQLVEATYTLPFQIITEATWIKEYLKEHYNRDAYLVHNGIRKDIYNFQGECVAPRKDNKLRILVEGPVDVPFKNVPKTIQLCQQSKADEIWLMTSSDIKEYPGVDKVFSRVPIFDTPKIYRSCDVIIKLSYVEGMFGPPLEMYHCGGTSVTYDVTGYDEYIVHNYNGIVVKTDQESEVISYINKLKEDPRLLAELKSGAQKTALEWDSWEEAAKKFYDTIYEICKSQSITTQREMEVLSKFHFKSYVIAEDYLNELKFKKNTNFMKLILIKIHKKFPDRLKNSLKNKNIVKKIWNYVYHS